MFLRKNMAVSKDGISYVTLQIGIYYSLKKPTGHRKIILFKIPLTWFYLIPIYGILKSYPAGSTPSPIWPLPNPPLSGEAF